MGIYVKALINNYLQVSSVTKTTKRRHFGFIFSGPLRKGVCRLCAAEPEGVHFPQPTAVRMAGPRALWSSMVYSS